MRIGVFLFPESRDPSKDDVIIDEALEEAKTAERLGADAVFLAEHHFDGNCGYVDPPVFAAALSQVTSRIKIGFAVLQTSLYHPLRMAEQISLIDHLTKGRLIVGLGRGSLVNTHEYEGFQIDPDSAQERFEEIEKILFDCWAGEKVQHSGKYWNFEIPMLRPRPYTKPHPQVLRSVASTGSLVAMAKKGRPLIIGAPTTRHAAERVALYRTTMKEAGFSQNEVDKAVSECWVARPAILGPTTEEAEKGLVYLKAMQDYRSKQSIAFQQKFAAASAQTQEPRMLCGTPDDIRPEYEAIRDTGVGGVIIRFRQGPMPLEFSLRSLELFMKEIAPAVREAPRVAMPA
jgi:alkanesulfonate monooxygenase SsuD/methylene tetrahydromethanopterin reductase-like flavin-dependent oxidoreductase (luciferase family)